jgi:hypothetical protein
LLTITSAPSWAEGAHRPAAVTPGSWRPDPRQFGAFARAAALRYDGQFPDPQNLGSALPRIQYWQPWNEPNLDYYLSPQWVHSSHGWSPDAPVRYRQMLNAFYAAVKRVAPSNFVLMGGTAPYGDPAGSDPLGQERTTPVDFYQSVFRDRVYLDGVDHHPYGVVGPEWHALNAGDVAVPDIYKISRVLSAAQHAGHLLPRGPKPIWVGEIGWSTSPPNPGGVPVAEQARWYEQSLYVLWRQGVHTVLFLELADPSTGSNPSAVFESGLYYCPCYRRGAPAKPAATAFRFPFITQRQSAGRLQAWGRAPAAGQLEIQVLRARRWETIRTLAASRGQVFQATLALAGRAILRARLGSDASVNWPQGG